MGRKYNKTKRNQHYKNDSSVDLGKKFGNSFGSDIFTPNPSKKNRKQLRKRDENKRVSFHDGNDKITQISLKKRSKDSVFFSDDTKEANNNTIHRNKLPNRGARKSRFGMHDKPSLLKKKSSTFK